MFETIDNMSFFIEMRISSIKLPGNNGKLTSDGFNVATLSLCDCKLKHLILDLFLKEVRCK